jgi:DNA repair exonuclease SbcCD ATPase subunit/DNA repair exonuclease SbcCD nuclease subunit
MINKIVSNLKTVDCILHISDIHLRNWKRHKEFKEVFDKLFKVIDKLPANSIVTVGGDIVHAKTDMSPELINMVSYLFNELANRIPTIVICGNHDTNLNNNNRLDALTPIVEANSHKNLYYLRNSGLYEIGDIAISVMSLLDTEDSYIPADKIKKEYKHTVAMYHGTISNSQVDSGLFLSHGLNWDIFAGYDLVLLGDIHKRQILSKQEPIIFYPGSLVQQNFGEAYEGHGYAICDLTVKGDIKYEFHDIHNQYGFYTLDVVNGVIPTDLPINSKTNLRIRVKNTTPAELKRSLATIRKLYRCNDVIVQRLDRAESKDTATLFGEAINQGDIRNVQYQNGLLTDYLTQQNVDDETITQVLKINTLLNQTITQGEAARNVIWIPKKFEFDNMFSYGEGNVIDFTKFDGTCGLFAPNHAGKSAILDSICFCLFDQSFRANQAIQVLNRKKDGFWCKFEFELGGLSYFVEKRATKYAKGPLKGKLRVDIDFWSIDESGVKTSLNGEQRRDTDKIIQSYIGTFDDFILTALSLQGNNSNFIDKTQGERKELLANFLDLNIFDTLYELANKETRTATILLEEYQKQDFETRLGDAERMKDIHTENCVKAQERLDKIELELEDLQEELRECNKRLQPCTTEGLDKGKLKSDLKISEDAVERYENEKVLATSLLQQATQDEGDLFARLEDYKRTFNSALYKDYLEKVKIKTDLDNTLSTFKITITNKLSKLEKLKQHEYDPNCKYCTSNVFVQDAVETKSQLDHDKQVVHDFLINLKEVADFIDQNKSIQVEADQIQNTIKEHNNAKIIVERQANVCTFLEKNIDIENHKIQKLKSDIANYEANESLMKENAIIHQLIKGVQNQLTAKKIELSSSSNTVKDIHAKIKVSEQTIAECNKSIAHMYELADKQVAYEQYCKAVSKDGIPYIMISKAVPYIQDYANNILSQIIDFTIELETDGKNINAFICYDDTKWSLELSSGMERFLSSLALRIALIKITNLSKPNFIAIDEGLGVLDGTNLNSMNTLFTHMKDLFKFTLIISHIDVVRDMVDTIITIDRKEDFSYIKH